MAGREMDAVDIYIYILYIFATRSVGCLICFTSSGRIPDFDESIF